MRWHDVARPVRMQRVALVAPAFAVRDVLVHVADAGVVEFDNAAAPPAAPGGEAAARLARAKTTEPRLARSKPNLNALEGAGRWDLLTGEAQLEEHAADAVTHGEAVAWLGWVPSTAVVPLRDLLAQCGSSVVALPRPPTATPPTLLRGEGAGGAFGPLVQTYATVPYADVDPTMVAGIAYTVMFGMMFADAGHGAVLALAALAARFGRFRLLAPLRRVWVFLACAGLSGIAFGVAYGEFFGPSGVLRVRWLNPLDQPVQLLVAAIAVGAVLLAGAYALGTVNRWREGGWRLALYATSGLAGGGLFFGLGSIVAGWYMDWGWLLAVGSIVVVVALTLAFAGLLAEAGGGSAGVVQAAIELFDTVVRLGSNVFSFARLAAFGLTHAALGFVVWQATTNLWRHGAAGAFAAAVVFLAGNALTFALEALVAGIQALRLEYYELFSRVFATEGHPFRPWHVPTVHEEALMTGEAR